MIRLTVDARHPSPSAIAAAADVIRRGGLVAFPTETVYGLGADALDETAVLGIFAAKGRPAFNPLIAHVASVAQAQALVTNWPATATALSSAFWPGPLTLVLPRAAHVPDALTAGRESVAVRMPAHPVALALIAAAERPIAAPSANRFTEVSPTTADHVQQGLGDRVDVLLDGGATEVGIESTVVDLTGPVPVLLRPGTIPRDALAQVLGMAVHDPAPVAHAEEARPSPGMIDRHYAPHARVELVSADMLAGAVAHARTAGASVGVLLYSAHPPAGATIYRLPDEALGYAHGLYAVLHAADADGCAVLVVEQPPRTSAWDGVNDRLRRAAHPADA